MTPQDRKELKFILKTAKEILISVAVAIAMTLTFLIISIWT
jgi:hypothetical protein